MTMTCRRIISKKTNLKFIVDKIEFSNCVLIFVLIVCVYSIFCAFEKKTDFETMKNIEISLFHFDINCTKRIECFRFRNCQ